MRRVSEVQSKISLRKANKDRQYGNGSVSRFGVSAGKIIDLFPSIDICVPIRFNSGTCMNLFSNIFSIIEDCLLDFDNSTII